MIKDNDEAHLHWNIQQWKSILLFMDDEIQFITQLLKSSAFKSKTPNLFERLQNYGTRVEDLKERNLELKNIISILENDLGGIEGHTAPAMVLDDYKRRDKLQAEMDDYLENFQNLKLEIFNYARGVLKMPTPEGE